MSRFLSQKIANYINGITYEDLPQDVIRRLKMNLLDSIGISIYASDLPWSQIIVEQIRELGGARESTIIGYAEKNSRPYAALANGTFAHGLEFDNAHWSHVHPGPPTIAAALSVAEKEKSSGKALLTSILAGFEVALAIGKAVFPSHRYRGFQPTATIGTFGAAAAAGKLMNMDEDQIASALGLAGTQASGLNEWIHSGDMSKRIHAGKAAMNGIFAVLFAKKGLVGPISVFEGGDGFFKAYADETDESVFENIWNDLEVRNVWIKPYATCADFHGAIKLTLKLIEAHKVRSDDIENVRICVDSISKKYDSKKVETLLDAQMHYSVAVAIVLLAGDGFFDAFLKWHNSPQVKELVKKIDVVVDSEIDNNFPQKWGCKVEITTKSGETYKASEKDRQPMSDDDIKTKFRRLARKKLDDDQIEKIIEVVENIEEVEEVSSLNILLTSN